MADGGPLPAPVRLATGAEAGAGAGDPEDESLLREIAICGTADDCQAAIRRLLASGADEIVLAPQGDELETQVTRFATDVLPALRA